VSSSIQVVRDGSDFLIVEDGAVVARAASQVHAERISNALTHSEARWHVALFRHAAKLTGRSIGWINSDRSSNPLLFVFDATDLKVQLGVHHDTSPFHDLPDGTVCYVEIGVDMHWLAQYDVKAHKIVEEFVRHGFRRPKFGPLGEIP